MADGNSSPQELIQGYSVKITQAAYDILVGESKFPATGSTLYDIQKAIVAKEEEGEVTSSANTLLPPIGDNRAGTSRIVNGENRSSGSAVGVGQWIGTFSGSVDIFRTGSGFATFHFTHFSGGLAATNFEVGTNSNPSAHSSNYGKVFIGAPDDLTNYITSSLPLANGGIPLYPKSFSGSFVTANDFHTVESGSSSGSEMHAWGSQSGVTNKYIPGGTFTAKWISGSFPGSTYSASLGTNPPTLFTSSTVTVADLNNISQSNFVGSICVTSGGFDGAQNWATTFGNAGNAISTGGDYLDATCEVAFSVIGNYGGEFRNSGSLIENVNTGPLVSGLTAGTIFAVAPSGSGETLVSGSIESITDGGYVNRGPGEPYINEAASPNYFATQRTVSVTGEVDKFQKAAKKALRTIKFSPR